VEPVPAPFAARGCQPNLLHAGAEEFHNVLAIARLRRVPMAGHPAPKMSRADDLLRLATATQQNQTQRGADSCKVLGMHCCGSICRAGCRRILPN